MKVFFFVLPSAAGWPSSQTFSGQVRKKGKPTIQKSLLPLKALCYFIEQEVEELVRILVLVTAEELWTRRLRQVWWGASSEEGEGRLTILFLEYVKKPSRFIDPILLAVRLDILKDLRKGLQHERGLFCLPWQQWLAQLALLITENLLSKGLAKVQRLKHRIEVTGVPELWMPSAPLPLALISWQKLTL